MEDEEDEAGGARKGLRDSDSMPLMGKRPGPAVAQPEAPRQPREMPQWDQKPPGTAPTGQASWDSRPRFAVTRVFGWGCRKEGVWLRAEQILGGCSSRGHCHPPSSVTKASPVPKGFRAQFFATLPHLLLPCHHPSQSLLSDPILVITSGRRA